jgi:hypothetical protein
VGGTNIGGYTASTAGASVTPTTLTNPSLTTYFPYAGTNTVSFQYCANIQGANPVYQCSLPANAAFDVTGPTVSTMSTPTGRVDIFEGPKLGFGPIGIQFNPTISNDTGVSGQFEWAQLLTNTSLQYTTTSGTVKNCVDLTVPPTTGGTGLDGRFPYDVGTSTHDSPSVALDSALYTAETKTFGALMFLMWDPALPDSIPISLGYVTWGWSGTATTAAGNWLVTTSSITTPTWTPSYSFPTWQVYDPDLGQYYCPQP